MITVNELSKEVSKILEDYTDTVEVVTDETIDKVADETVRELKNTSPKDKGAYAKGWAKKPIVDRFRKGQIVWNKKHYRLTHLLENGHDIVSKSGKRLGRTKPIPHIKPAEEKAVRNLQNDLVRNLNDIK